MLMTADDIEYHKRWRAASGHPGGWRVCRKDYTPGAETPLQEACGPSGKLRLFRSREAAERAATTLNESAE